MLCEKCPNSGKWGPEKNPYLHTIHGVIPIVETFATLITLVWGFTEDCLYDSREIAAGWYEPISN